MYDTIHFWLSREKVPNINLLGTIPKNLTEITLEGYNKHDERFIRGDLGNFKVYISDRGVSIKGSLPKLYLGDNIQILTRQDTQKAIELISGVLALPINKAKVNRLDIGYNLMTKHLPKTYYSYLGDARYLGRYVQPNSIYYSNKKRVLIFYDKIAESKNKGVQIPSIYQNSNLLRYELRFMKGVSKQLKQEVIGETLYNEAFYYRMIDLWHSNYKVIHKVNSFNLQSLKNIKSPRDYFQYLALSSLNSTGLNHVLEEIELMRSLNIFKQAEYYSRLKRDVKKLANSKIFTTTSELIEELDKKVNQVVKTSR